jgi:hypothetical protein
MKRREEIPRRTTRIAQSKSRGMLNVKRKRRRRRKMARGRQ